MNEERYSLMGDRYLIMNCEGDEFLSVEKQYPHS